MPEIEFPQLLRRPGKGFERLGKRFQKLSSAPPGVLSKPLPELALPDKVGVGFHPSAFILHFFGERQPLLMEPEPLEHPVEPVARIGDENGADALRERKDLLFRSSSQAILKPHRFRLHFLPEASRSSFSEDLPDHPVRFVADHVGERLLRKEAEPLREEHELHRGANLLLAGDGARQVRFNSLRRNDDGHTVEDALKERIRTEFRSFGTKSKPLDVAKEHRPKDFVAVAVKRMNHGSEGGRKKWLLESQGNAVLRLQKD